jgi:hypothetical protein
MRTLPTQAKASQRLSQPYQQWATGDGVKTTFFLTKAPTLAGGLLVSVHGLVYRPDENGTAYDYAVDGNKVTFHIAPTAGWNIGFFLLSV